MGVIFFVCIYVTSQFEKTLNLLDKSTYVTSQTQKVADLLDNSSYLTSQEKIAAHLSDIIHLRFFFILISFVLR